MAELNEMVQYVVFAIVRIERKQLTKPIRLSRDALFKLLFHNIFRNRPQIVLWHTHKEIEQRFEVNTKWSTRMCISHHPKLDDIIQKELCHHQPR